MGNTFSKLNSLGMINEEEGTNNEVEITMSTADNQAYNVGHSEHLNRPTTPQPFNPGSTNASEILDFDAFSHINQHLRPKTKSSITITKIPRTGSNSVSISIDMNKVYKAPEEVISCLVETNDSDSSEDNQNYYNSLTRANNRSIYQTMSHSKLIKPFKDHQDQQQSERPEAILSSSPSLYENLSEHSYRTISQDDLDPMALNLTGFGNFTGLELPTTPERSNTGVHWELNLSPRFIALDEKKRATEQEMPIDMNVSYGTISPIASQQIHHNVEQSLDNQIELMEPGEEHRQFPRRSLRLIEQQDRQQNEMNSPVVTLKQLYLSQLMTRQQPKKRPRRKAAKKIFEHKATQTEDKYFSMNQSDWSDSGDDSEYEAPRRSHRRLEKSVTAANEVHPMNDEEMNAMSVDNSDYYEVERNFRELPNALEQTDMEPLNEPMELSLTEDNVNQPMCSKDVPSSSRKFRVDPKNVTIRRKHPAYKKPMGKKSKQENNNFDHLLNSKHITIRRGNKNAYKK